MEMLCPECLTPLISNDGQTARCPAHAAQFRILFTRYPVVTPAAPAPNPVQAPLGGGPPPLPQSQLAGNPPISADEYQLAPEITPVGSAIPALLPPVAKLNLKCQVHPNADAVVCCHSCGAPVCATCDFSFPGNLHLCPNCAINPRQKLSTGRRKLVGWSVGLAIWNTLGIILIFVGAFAGLGKDKAAVEALGVLLSALFMLPTLIGLALGLASIEKRMSNPALAWIAAIWNGVLLGIWILLIIRGTMAG